MTLHLADLASYQGALSADALKAAGFGVNIKVSHGLGQKSVHPAAPVWAMAARTLGLRISTFHWLTADASGEAQADYAYGRLRTLGLDAGTAHQLDVESSPAPPLASVRGYLTRMTQLLGRPVVLYTGDWWWKPKGWDVSDLTPYLWSAPNAGYLGSYPGDSSQHWRAGYGGWAELAVMQYAVKTLPGTSIKVSMSAVRDEAIWRTLTLGRADMSYAPDSIMDARKLVMDTLRAAGVKVEGAAFGVIGDDAHAASGTSYHLGKDALKSGSYSVVESSRDKNGLTNAASAFDFGWFSITVKGKGHNLRSFSVWLVAQCKAGTADTLDIREVIYSADGQTVKRWDRLGVRGTGPDSHLTHTHISWFRDSEKRNKAKLFARYFTEIGLIEGEDDMPTVKEFWDTDGIVTNPKQRADADTNPSVRPAFTLADSWAQIYNLRDMTVSMRTQIDGLTKLVGAVLANVQADDKDRASIEAAIRQIEAATAASAAQAVRDTFAVGSPDDVAAALLAALGPDRAAAVGAILKR